MEALFLIVAVVGVILWLATRSRLISLEKQLSSSSMPALHDRVRELTARVFKLEQGIDVLSKAAALPAPAAGAVSPVAQAAEASPKAPPLSAETEFFSAAASIVDPTRATTAPEPVSASPFWAAEIARGQAAAEASQVVQPQTPTPAPPAQPVVPLQPAPSVVAPTPPGPSPAEASLGGRLRAWLGDEEWEALVGASLLNKLGALVTVIGFTLLLSFSFTHMGPAGRAATAMSASVALLGGGGALERRLRYRIYARGLIGAGWAGVYATTYAIHWVPAARIIDDSVLGSFLLVLVALGMIAHSFHYRNATVTAVAYFTAFAAFAVAPPSTFAVVSLVPLAASLLYLAWHFRWHAMALYGMVATYLTCIYRGSSDAPLIATEALFVTYWLLFEAFDLMRVRRRLQNHGLGWIFPLNAVAFLGLSYTSWSAKDPQSMWRIAAFAAALFLTTSVARFFLIPRWSFSESDGLSERLAAGSYEASLALSAVLAGLAIVGRAQGVWIGVSLAVEAELIYLAGLKLRSRFIRGLGVACFVFSLSRVLLLDLPPMEQMDVRGHAMYIWSPVALLHAVIFYVNHALGGAAGFYFAATALVAGVGAAELPARVLGTVWLLYAFVLFEIGIRKRRVDFRAQAYVLALLGVAATVDMHGVGAVHKWIPLAVSLAAAYGQALRIRWFGSDRLGEDEHWGIEWVLTAASAMLASLLLWRTIGQEYLGLSWCLLALVILELGLRQWPQRLRWFAYPLAVLGGVGVQWTHVEHFAKLPPASTWISYFGAAACGLAMAARLLWPPRVSADAPERDVMRDLLCLGSAGLLLAAIWMVTPDPFVSLLWCALGVAWIETGLALHLSSFRALGCGVLGAMLIHLNMVDSGDPIHRWWILAASAAVLYFVSWRLRRLPGAEKIVAAAYRIAPALVVASLMHLEFGAWDSAGWAMYGLALLALGVRRKIADLRWEGYALALGAWGWSGIGLDDPSFHWWIAALAAGTLYAAQFVTPKSPLSPLESRVRTALSILGTTLVTWLLYERVSGGYLTVACGAQGVALLAAGFPLRERVLRLQGLALLLFCILKLFLYDLRNLETLYRILSFITLGLILLGVSWVYTRFRDRIRTYL